jgi:nitrate reductase assembly molybdenum cofactor insertion protein NarJ
MTTTLNPAATRLLGEAIDWRLLSVLLERPVPGWHETVGLLAHDAADAELRPLAAGAGGATEGGYLAAFGPGGVASPREIAHTKTRDPGHLLAQLRAIYDAFAYRPRTEETPDHVSVEAGFVAYLRMKEAFAIACGRREAAAIAAEAASGFLERHLSTFVQPLAEQLSTATDDYLAGALQALLHRTGQRRPDAEGGWTPDGLEDACLDCPGCEPLDEPAAR